MTTSGRRSERSIDGHRRVSGGTTFVNDVRAQDALHVAFTLSTEEHALIRGVDVAPALAVSGVVAAISAADIGPIRIGRIVKDYPLLAIDRVLHVGQRVAAVAAVDRRTAQLAADLVVVDYEPLPPVRDAAAAIAPGAPTLHPEYDTYQGALTDRTHPNEQGRWELSHGDATSAFAACDEVIENTFTVPRLHSAPLEPHACVIVPGEVVHVYATHKAPYDLRKDLALISGRPPEEFVIHPAHIGGDFGSKGVPHVEGACYFLATATGRPVRSVMSYYEELTATGARHPTTITLRTGLRDGHMHAHVTDVRLEGGAFAALKAHPRAVVPAIKAPVEVYEVPNVDEVVECFYTNALSGAHVRSPGEFQAAFAGESHVDLIARSAGVDPIDYRIQQTENPRLHRVLETLREKVDAWRAEQAADDDPDRGIGISVSFRDSGPGSTTAWCRATRDGTVEVRVAVPDQGAGSYTLFRRLAADTLGLEEPVVTVRPAATDSALADSGAGASRVSAVAGRATVQACRVLLEELGKPPGDRSGTPHWIAARLAELGRDDVEVTGSWAMGWPPPEGADIRSYAATAIEVSVDRETGEYDVRRAVIVADTGVVVNPVAHRGQVEGGFVYGLSQATLEELVVEEGQVVSASLGDYRLMSAADVAPLEVVVLPLDEDPFEGMRSVGELTNVSAAPALANAIHDAVGVRIRDLPITPERVHAALRTMAAV